MSCPRSIYRTAGERSKIILGDTGSDYVFIYDNDDGDTKWQSRVWETKSGIPDKLLQQINNCVKKGRDVTQIASGNTGGWFISGEKSDGLGGHSWWGGMFDWDSSFSSYYSDSDNKKNYRKVSIAEDGTQWLIHNEYIEKELEKDHYRDPVTDIAISGDGSWVVLRKLSYATSEGISDKLRTYIGDFYTAHKKRYWKRKKEIKEFYRKKAEEEERLRKESERLQKVLEEQKRQREAEEERIRLEEEAKKQEIIRKEAEEKERLLREEAKRDLALKRKLMDDRKLEIVTKRVKVGDHVTALGFSQKSGDAVVQSIDNEGIMTLNCEGKLMDVLPDKVVLPTDFVKDAPSEFLLVCMAQDKYEAAVSIYHCLCDDSSCACTKISSANLFLPENLRNKEQIDAGTRVFVKGLAFGTIVGSAQSSFLYGRKSDMVQIKYDNDNEKVHHVHQDQLQLQYISACPVSLLDNRGANNNNIRPFDLYKCIEKINIKRLYEIKLNLARDSVQRAQLAEQMMDPEKASQYDPTSRKKLLRCCELEALVNALYEYVKDLPRDQSNQNFVEYEVQYEHKDSSGRGRMFAKGLYVKLMSSESYPRTATLQGMHKELRAPLIGQLAHDIDCVNSEVALLCSLAMQMNLKDLVPTLFKYRDNRTEWIQKVSAFHNVSESDAKRLSTIIINGGRYETWKKAVGIHQKDFCRMNKEEGDKIRSFVFQLRSEVDALRDKALLHPQFRWTLVEREKLGKLKGISGRALDTILLPRIIQYCENEVLSIIHRCFFDANWFVRAKVFDGLIVEKGPNATSSLQEVILIAESSCKSLGWDTKLIEKPLYGKQDDALNSIEEARDVMSILC